MVPVTNKRVRRDRPALLLTLATLLVAVLLAGCATTAPGPASASGTSGAGGQGGNGGPGGNGPAPIAVVAAEDMWGSLAAQLGGPHATVHDIIDNPAADPHDYEPTPADGRAIASAQLVIVNGIGYDPWAGKLVAANPDPRRTTLTVGQIVGVPDGGNPHRLALTDYVRSMIDRITAAYQAIDPADTQAFATLHDQVVNRDLEGYFGLISTIRATYAGTPIAASESIVTPLAEALGLVMKTPESFLDAVSEGTEPTPGDLSTIDHLLENRLVKVYVYNSQNATPDVRAQLNLARASGIRVATVTETLTPRGATFQDWQVAQLTALQHALAAATGR